MSEIANEAESLARHLIGAADASARELLDHGRQPARIVMHPFDVDAIYEGLFPDFDRSGSEDLTVTTLNLQVVEDEDAGVGVPVAEFDP